ncbi:MAG: magnesium chelatase ATPase subunit I [Planctomycetes bacterium]|nr:magnesium chelatase ATPase subunit I [Planctomycetota bacterium]
MLPTRQTPGYPFAAIVGQDALKLALLLNVVDPSVGGVMIMGHRGCGKSTAVRGLAELMPPIDLVEGCPFHCAPEQPAGLCGLCEEGSAIFPTSTRPVPVVDLPLGATEDRVTGSLDLEAALVAGRKAFEPGILARAHRGFLYIDEANLLEDHLVDLLLDVAAAGENIVERESVSVRHPARFVLIGSGNPEEGELRPQLMDRFGLYARIVTDNAVATRVEIVRRRLAFDADPDAFCAEWADETEFLRARVLAARERTPGVEVGTEVLVTIASLNADLEIDGHRGELTLARAARARAAFEGRTAVEASDLRATAHLALEHRLRRDPLENRPLLHRIDEVLERHLPGRS